MIKKARLPRARRAISAPRAAPAITPVLNVCFFSAATALADEEADASAVVDADTGSPSDVQGRNANCLSRIAWSGDTVKLSVY